MRGTLPPSTNSTRIQSRRSLVAAQPKWPRIRSTSLKRSARCGDWRLPDKKRSTSQVKRSGEITGADTWIRIDPVRLGGEPLSDLYVTVHGKYPFYGESLEVYDSSGLHYRRRTFPYPAPPSLIATATLGTYYPRLSTPLSLSVPVTSERAQMFEFRIRGRTGVIQELLSLYRSGDTWLTALEIHKGKKLLVKWKDPRFPDDWKLEVPAEPLDPKLSRTPEY
jgi:hypothetical protein